MFKCKSVRLCVCMCDSLLIEENEKKCLARGPEGQGRERLSQKVERERETCSLNEGSCVKEIQRKREGESFVGCRAACVTVHLYYTG